MTRMYVIILTNKQIMDQALLENEKGQSGNIPTLSSQVGKTGLLPGFALK
jgi:hypothetical protein